MLPIRPFRNSLYLSLAIALGSLGYAAGDLLPEVPFITVFGLLLLGVAYWMEGRYALNLRDANIVGLFLGVLLGLWGIFQAVRPPTGLPDMLPWPASALPYLAPVLMILVPAKLLRPKHIGDYWTMHGLGLVTMALACAMASEGMFVFLFGAYVLSFVWGLAAFHLYREVRPELATQPINGQRWRSIRPAAAATLVASIAAIPLFWLTPRSGSQWELGINSRGKASIGMSDGPVDLNRTGSLDQNREVAFEVVAVDRSGAPATTVVPDQKWRVAHLQSYDNGRWTRNQTAGLETRDRATTPLGSSRDYHDRVVDFGPDTIYLTFTASPRGQRGPALAEPVVWKVGEKAPIATRFSDGTYRTWVHRFDGSFDGQFLVDSGTLRYVQAWSPRAQTAFVAKSTTVESLARATRGAGRIKQYADALVLRLVDQGDLPRDVVANPDPVTRNIAAKHHEVVARAFENHLSNSGEFNYSLELTRQDRNVDPIEDFLLNTKSGHCQRFATALALMLRSQGIPCQFVLGFRGCEQVEDGKYLIRQDDAHAWVEALIPDSTNIVFGADQLSVRWIVLDATPGGSLDDANGSANLLSQARQRWDSLLRSLLLAYNRESREQTIEAIRNWFTEGNGTIWIGSVLVLAGCLVALRRSRRRHALAQVLPPYMKRLVDELARRGIVWQESWTAEELAASASRALPVDLANVPAIVVAAYYGERFGQRAITTEETKELLADLARLEHHR